MSIEETYKKNGYFVKENFFSDDEIRELKIFFDKKFQKNSIFLKCWQAINSGKFIFYATNYFFCILAYFFYYLD